MKHLILFAGMAFSTLVLAGADGPVQPAATPTAQPTAATRNADAEKLIDELVNVDAEVVGAYIFSGPQVSQFLAGDELPAIPESIKGFNFKGSLPGAPPPAMRQLVQMGVPAVPSLLDHLTDARETKLVIEHPGPVGGMEYGDEYDPRYRGDPARAPDGVASNANGARRARDGFAGQTYTIKVGDLCYVLLGQIVGRNLTAARYQATEFVVINSPVHTPALAAAARMEWTGLTPELHRSSLENDLAGDAHSLTQRKEVAERLSYYYPDAVKDAAIKALSLPIADWHLADLNSTITNLLAEADPAAQAALLTATQKRRGNVFISQMVDQLKIRSNPPQFPPGSQINLNYYITDQPRLDHLQTALKTIAAEGWLASLQGQTPALVMDQVELINSLGAVKDPAVDAAVHDFFRRALAMWDNPVDATDTTFDNVALACAQRLAGKGHDDEYRAFFNQRLGQLSNDSTSNEKSITKIMAVLVRLSPPAARSAVKP